MPPMQPPMPRPVQPGFMRNDSNSMQNTGWRNAYPNPIGANYMDNVRPSLPGFYISDPNNISARDVPMDGSISFFPASDLSYIIIKQWNGNGMISEAKYIPAPIATQTETQKQQGQQNQDTPDNSSQSQETNQNSEIVEVISAALNEQTQRLTAAFSQIGMAFTTLQEKLDSFGSSATLPASNTVPSLDLKTPAPMKKMKAKQQEGLNDEKN